MDDGEKETETVVVPVRSARTGRRWRAARRGRARRAWCRGRPPAGWRGRGGAARRAPCAPATRPTSCAAPTRTCCAPCAPSATARGGPAAPRGARRPPTRTSSCPAPTPAAEDPSFLPVRRSLSVCPAAALFVLAHRGTGGLWARLTAQRRRWIYMEARRATERQRCEEQGKDPWDGVGVGVGWTNEWIIDLLCLIVSISQTDS